MNQTSVKDMGGCWICFNNENNTILTTVDSESTLKSCETYLDISIIIKDFEKDTSVSCCSCCLESTRQLISLEEQVQKLQKEISDVSSAFSKNVLQRRSRLQNQTDNATKSVLPTQKGFRSPDDCLSYETTENVTFKTEVIESEKLQADPLGNIKIDGNIISDPWFETTETEDENVNKNQCVIAFDSEDPIDIKYSYDVTVSKAVDSAEELFLTNQGLPAEETITEEHQQNKPTFILLQCLKTPIIRLERLQLSTDRRTPKIVAADGQQTKCENNVEENRLHECTVCGLGYLNKLDLQNHVKLHEKERPYACAFCDKSFLLPKRLKRHEKIHTGKRPFTCSICSKSFIRSDHLRKHERTHQETKPQDKEKQYSCSFCSKSLKSAYTLKIHEKSHTEEKQYKCSSCAQSFLLLCQLDQHSKTHSEDRPYKCSFCKKSFLHPTILKTHERVHTGERPFECSFCSKSFISSSSLKRHGKHHSEEKHKCSSCSKSFISSSYLRTHQKTHCEERPHQCSLCKKSFKRLDHLRDHERSHSGERPYKCSFCPKSFIQSEKAKRHMMTHTGQKPYKCSNCEKTFSSRYDLKIHYNRQHADEAKNEEFILP